MKFFTLMVMVFISACAAHKINPETNNQKPCYTVKACTAEIQKKIERYWRIPAESSVGLEAKVRVRLNESAGIKLFYLEKSSGSTKYDDSILKAVVRASPFPKIVGTNKKNIEQLDEIVFSFRVNSLNK